MRLMFLFKAVQVQQTLCRIFPFVFKTPAWTQFPKPDRQICFISTLLYTYLQKILVILDC